MTGGPRRRRRLRAVGPALALGAVAGCAATPPGQSGNDPLEPINRVVFGFNILLDDFILQPLSDLYTFLVPEPGREAIGNFFANISSPYVILNDVLQGRFDEGLNDLGRLAVNSTLGIGGLFDPASDLGLPAREQSFDVTLGMWGLDEGPYVVLPFFGPSTLRGVPDVPLRIFTNPLYYFDASVAKTVLGGVGSVDTVAGTREEMHEVKEALDPYIFLRDAYLQRQRYLIGGPEAEENPFETMPPPEEQEEQKDQETKPRAGVPDASGPPK